MVQKISNETQFYIICGLLFSVILTMLFMASTFSTNDIRCTSNPKEFFEAKYNATCSCFSKESGKQLISLDKPQNEIDNISQKIN